jgi:hypothetical protein
MDEHASAPGTPTSCFERGKHSDVEECKQQQDADVADGQQVHNLSLGHTFALVAGGTTAGAIPYSVLSRCTTVGGTHPAPGVPPQWSAARMRACG